MLNKMSELKNEHARAQAEWQREKSKFESLKQDAIEIARKEIISQNADQVRDAKVVIERVWKKKLDEK